MTCSYIYPVYVAQIQIAVVDYEMHKDRSFNCDVAEENITICSAVLYTRRHLLC